MHIRVKMMITIATLSFVVLVFFLYINKIQNRDARLTEFLSSGIVYEYSKSVKELEFQLGLPVKIKSEKYNNPYGGVGDKICTYYYNGLEIQFIEFEGDKESSIMLTRIELNSGEWPLKHLKLGMSRHSVIQCLGEKYIVKDNVITYENFPETHTSANLYFKNQKLIKVDWVFYIG